MYGLNVTSQSLRCINSYNNNKNNNNDSNNTTNNNNRIQRHNLRVWQSPHCATNHLQHVCSSGTGAIVCKSRATHQVLLTCNMSCYMPRGMKRQLSYLSLTELKSHLFELYFIGWSINRWKRGVNRSTRWRPLGTSFRKCHILMPEDSSPKWDSNLHNSIGGRLGKQTANHYTTLRQPSVFSNFSMTS